jgi:hypothetical protein
MKFLKFASKEACIEAFAPYMNAEGTEFPAYIGKSAVDVVGVLWIPTGETLTNDDGTSFPDMAPLDGYHINLSGDCPESLLPFSIEVATPSRVFA